MKKILTGFLREVRYFFWIAAAGAGLILLGVGILFVWPDGELLPSVCALWGLKIIFLGYPVFLLFRIFSWAFKPGSKLLKR